MLLPKRANQIEATQGNTNSTKLPDVGGATDPLPFTEDSTQIQKARFFFIFRKEEGSCSLVHFGGSTKALGGHSAGLKRIQT